MKHISRKLSKLKKNGHAGEEHAKLLLLIILGSHPL